MTLQLRSPDFAAKADIPQQFTCDGKDKSPELSWQGAPITTKSFALICDDPDAPRGTWVHWVLFNIPGNINKLPAAAPTPSGAIDGLNSWGETGYRGPCPPSGKHRYYFKLYALDTTLNLPSRASKEDVMQAMQNHILASAELMGLYSRP